MVDAVGAAASEEETSTSEAALETYREAAAQAAAAALAGSASGDGEALRWAPAVEGAGEAERPLALQITVRGGADAHTIQLAPRLGIADSSRPRRRRRPSSRTAFPEADDAGLLDASARRNLEMMLDLELDLSVSFGRTVLPLDEVVRMSVGSIVQLNRSAADPVDVLVNNSVIARGEVVVIDGNYGVRVTQIASRQERLEKML